MYSQTTKWPTYIYGKIRFKQFQIIILEFSVEHRRKKELRTDVHKDTDLQPTRIPETSKLAY